MSIQVFDISVPIAATTVVWPSSPRPVLERRLAIARGDQVNDTNLFMNAHTATHVDAPLHHFDRGDAVERLSFDALLGDAWVLPILDDPFVTPDLLERVWPATGATRVLLQTRNSRLWADGASVFVEDYCALTAEAARWLVERAVRLVGIDYLSVQRFADPPTVHQVLLGAGVVLLEGLDLSKVIPGRYELLCLPLKVVGAEAAPARVVLRKQL